MDQERNSGGSFWIVCMILGLLFWSHYGIMASFSSAGYGHASELTFIWVCLIYAIFGTGLALILIRIQNDRAAFPAGARLWAVIAGIAGAGGAVFVIKAMKTGNPVYVMPLVFGPAQAFNALFTKLLQGFRHRPNRWFWIGLMGMIGFSFLVQMLKSGAGVEGIRGGEWLVWTLMAAASWGMYGVASRLSVMHSAKASGGHGSHLKVLLGVSLVYSAFGAGTWLFGAIGLSAPISADALFQSNSGIAFGILTGVMGLGGAAFIIPANSLGGSPGPIVVMAIVFMGAAGINSVATFLWEWIRFDRAPHLTLPFLLSLGGLALSGLVFSLNSPNRPSKLVPARAHPVPASGK